MTTRHPPGFRWVIAAFLCIILQIVATVAIPDQTWSMPTGTATLTALCAAVTIAAMPHPVGSTEAWRWRLVAIGFAIWASGWATLTFLATYERAFPYLSLIGLVRQVLFLIVLLPTVEEDQGWRLRALDVAQVVLLVAMLAILSWPGPGWFGIPQTSGRYLYVGHISLAVVAIASYLRQRGGMRRLIAPLMIAHSIYAATSVLAVVASERWNVRTNSPIWVFGDTAFLVYILVSLYEGHRPPRAPSKTQRTLRHFPPLLLTAVVLMLSFELRRRSLSWGMGAGIVGLLIYAARTTLLNDRYLAARDRLIEVEEARARALIDIVHEIRSPLGSVSLNAWLLANGDQLPEPQRRWVDHIHAGTTRVTTLLNDVLDLERLDAGLVELAIRPCDAIAIVTDALTVVAPQATEYGVTLLCPNAADLPPVLADPAKLGRVVVNLVTNAVRFTPGGGRVTITVETLDHRRVAITVADTGIGIPDAALPRLFERFSHIETPVNGLRGSGLGLSISRGLVIAMGGDLTIASTALVGTTATIVIPIADPSFPRP